MSMTEAMVVVIPEISIKVGDKLFFDFYFFATVFCFLFSFSRFSIFCLFLLFLVVIMYLLSLLACHCIVSDRSGRK